MSFSPEELEYLRSQPLARVATVATDGQPDVVPLAYEFDGDFFWVRGSGSPVLRTRKFRNVLAGNLLVALVIDDVTSHDPFVARGIRIYGLASAEPVERDGAIPGVYIQIRPVVSWSWNLGGEPLDDAWHQTTRTVHNVLLRALPHCRNKCGRPVPFCAYIDLTAAGELTCGMSTLPTPAASVPRMSGISPPPDDLLDWGWARQRLIDARNYWIVTVNSYAKPHARPVWGVWLDDGFWFSTGTVTTGNLAANNLITVHTESGDEVVIVEGEARHENDNDALAAMCQAYSAKYDYPLTAVDGEVRDASGAGGPGLQVIPDVVFGWGRDMASPTRWRFAAG